MFESNNGVQLAGFRKNYISHNACFPGTLT